MTLHKLIALGFDSDVHCDKTSFVGATIEFSDGFNMIFHKFSGRWQEVLVIVRKHVRLGVFSKLPVIQTVSVRVLEKWLVVVVHMG